MNIPTEKDLFTLALKGGEWDFGYLNRKDKQLFWAELIRLGFMRRSDKCWIVQYNFTYRSLRRFQRHRKEKHYYYVSETHAREAGHIIIPLAEDNH
jgi:hypothetical protein